MKTVYMLGKIHYKFSMIENWWLIIASAILFVVNKISDKRFDQAEEQDCDDWIQNNLPEYVDVYNGVVKELYSEFVNTIEKAIEDNT